MKIQTTRFGELQIEEHQVITFFKGIPGFNMHKKYVLLPAEEKGESPFFFLQSIEIEELSFLLLDTFSFFKEYDVKLEESVIEKLEIEKPEDVILLTTVSVKSEFNHATTNLKAPLVINHYKQIGMQIFLENSHYKIKQPLFKNSQKAAVGQV